MISTKSQANTSTYTSTHTQICSSSHPALPNPWPPYRREQGKLQSPWAAAPIPLHTHAHTNANRQYSAPNPQRTCYQLGWALLHQPDIHVGLEGGAPAGVKYRELWFTVRDREWIRSSLSVFLFVIVALSLCAPSICVRVCPSFSVCSDDYH